ncbi:hypothetical protein Y032_0016g3060 [Ancylostoma ceylanicum]|uniref:Uncharacterized protein n=1 Tax=Ancylostoma ceylanicum TaxID=53326 RepID=A0A016V8E3_9BILA|nr:hypothetical protein Y032_0016g3060 [Ancylostoma ceylanicum]
MWLVFLHLTSFTLAAAVLSPFLVGNDAFLTKEYINAITAYGPGLGVFTPYSYVDLSYDNLPFVGKIPVLGKEGTSSKLGISPFYPPQGNPSNPFPPLYRARPLPLHVPEPQDVVAVPLDEEALHGEPLFPPELALPSEQREEVKEEPDEKPTDPFGSSSQLAEKESVVDWPKGSELSQENVAGGENKQDKEDVITRVDKVAEKNMKEEDVAAIKPLVEGRPKNPFRTKRVRREVEFRRV